MNLPAAARVWIARHSAARRYALESGRDHAKFVKFLALQAFVWVRRYLQDRRERILDPVQDNDDRLWIGPL